MPLAGPANRQGRVAADSLCGRTTTSRGVQGTAICGVLGLTVATTGASERSLRRAGVTTYDKVSVHPGHRASCYPRRLVSMGNMHLGALKRHDARNIADEGIALFGVAEDDGVIMGTYLGQLFDEHTPTSVDEVRGLVLEAGEKRIRPCLMTVATTVIGLIPVFMATGRGSDVMQPMALPSMGGMAVSLITLFIVPCVYCWVEERALARRLAAPQGAPAPAAVGPPPAPEPPAGPGDAPQEVP